MRRFNQLVSLACLVVLLCPSAHARNPQDQGSQSEWWPEIDTYVKLNERASLMFEVSRTTDGINYSSADIGPTLQFTLKPILRRKLEVNNPEKRKYLTFAVGYRYIPTLDKPDENRVQLELTPRYAFPGSLLLSNRNRVDIRDIGGMWSWRFRERLTLERSFKIKKASLAPYAQGELFYDSRYDIWNRNVYEFGFTLGVRRWLDLKPYYAHQNDSRSSIPHVNAAGLTASFYFRNK
jgi:hypothetical protein